VDPRALFERGNEAARAGDYATALDLYQQALAVEPDRASLLYNAGSAAYFSGKYALSIEYYKKYLAKDPDDYKALDRLLVSAQAAGDKSEVEASIARLRAVRASGKAPEFAKQKSFVRDVFEADGHRVIAFEYFDPPMEGLSHLFDFVMIGPDHKPLRVYYVEYDAMTSAMLREQGQKNAEAWFYDCDYPEGRHASFRQTDHRPTYDEAKGIMLPIMEGKVQPASSSSKGKVEVNPGR
jgi:tetratricopeptide (TPR) repeat protein